MHDEDNRNEEEACGKEEEAYYYQTIRAFEELMNKYGAGNIILDMNSASVRALYEAYPRSLWT
jgi:hypothetical protein